MAVYCDYSSFLLLYWGNSTPSSPTLKRLKELCSIAFILTSHDAPKDYMVENFVHISGSRQSLKSCWSLIICASCSLDEVSSLAHQRFQLLSLITIL